MTTARHAPRPVPRALAATATRCALGLPLLAACTDNAPAAERRRRPIRAR